MFFAFAQGDRRGSWTGNFGNSADRRSSYAFPQLFSLLTSVDKWMLEQHWRCVDLYLFECWRLQLRSKLDLAVVCDVLMVAHHRMFARPTIAQAVLLATR